MTRVWQSDHALAQNAPNYDRTACLEASDDVCMDGNGNGRVDVDDLLLLLANFGKAC